MRARRGSGRHRRRGARRAPVGSRGRRRRIRAGRASARGTRRRRSRRLARPAKRDPLERHAAAHAVPQRRRQAEHAEQAQRKRGSSARGRSVAAMPPSMPREQSVDFRQGEIRLAERIHEFRHQRGRRDSAPARRAAASARARSRPSTITSSERPRCMRESALVAELEPAGQMAARAPDAFGDGIEFAAPVGEQRENASASPRLRARRTIALVL